jgi:hypothetical protein
MMEVMEIEEQESFNEEPVINDKQSRSLAIVAFLGSMDDLTLFVPLLVSNALTILQLAIGVMVATLFISFVCISLTRCQFVANFLEKIPLVAIVGTLPMASCSWNEKHGIVFTESEFNYRILCTGFCHVMACGPTRGQNDCTVSPCVEVLRYAILRVVYIKAVIALF